MEKKHRHGRYTWSDGKKYEGEFRDSKQHGRGIMTFSDGSRQEVEHCNGVRSAKKTPCAVDLVVGFAILSLLVYFGITFFYFILTTAGSVSEKMGITLERGVAHILATVRLSGVAKRVEHADILTREKKLDHSTEVHVEGNMIAQNLLNLHGAIDRQKETRTEVQQLNQRHKQSEETRHNQDIQIAILRQEIKSLQTNVAALEEKQSSVHTELRYFQKSYHHLQIQLDAVQGRERLLQYHVGLLKNIGSGDNSRNGESSSTDHTSVRTLQSPLTRGTSAGTHHNVTAREPHRAFTNDPPVINGGGLQSDGQLHKRLKSVRCKIQSKHQQRGYSDTIDNQHKMMHESKLLENIQFNSRSVQEEAVSKPIMSKTAMLLEQKIENITQSEIEDSSDKSGNQGH